mgnify:CR=1 FL=1
MDTAPAPPIDPMTRMQMEQAYAQMLSAVVELARLLGKPCPVKGRDERRRERTERAS